MPDGAKFCAKCGTRVETFGTVPDPGRGSGNPGRGKKLMLILIPLLLRLGVGGFFVYSRQPAVRLKRYMDLGMKYLSEMKYEEALLNFEKAISLDPKAVDAYIAMAGIYERQEDLNAATRCMEDGIGEAGVNAFPEKDLERLCDWYEELAQEAEEKNDRDQVLEFYGKRRRVMAAVKSESEDDETDRSETDRAEADRSEDGWVETGGRKYYLNEDGSLARDCWVDGYYLNSDGETLETEAMKAYGRILSEYMYGYRGSVNASLDRTSWNPESKDYRYRYLLKDANGDGIRELCIVDEVYPAEGSGAGGDPEEGFMDEALFTFIKGEVKEVYAWHTDGQFELFERPEIPYNNRASWDWFNGDLEICSEYAHDGAMSRSRLNSDGELEEVIAVYGFNADRTQWSEHGQPVDVPSDPARYGDQNGEILFDYGPELDRKNMTKLTAESLKREFNTTPEAFGLSMQPQYYSRLELSKAALKEMQDTDMVSAGTGQQYNLYVYGGQDRYGNAIDSFKIKDAGDYYELEKVLYEFIPLFVSKDASLNLEILGAPNMSESIRDIFEQQGELSLGYLGLVFQIENDIVVSVVQRAGTAD